MSAVPPESRRAGKLVAKLFVSASLLAYLSSRVDFAQIGTLLHEADRRWLTTALLLYLAGQVLSAFKWRRLALALGFEGSAARFVTHYFIGMFFNAFGFGTIGGDLIRALYLAGSHGPRARALHTVVADRVSGLLVLLAVALAALLAFHQYELPAAIYWTVVALSSSLLGGWRLLPWLLPRLLSPQSRLRRLVEDDLGPYWNDYHLLVSVGALSLAFHLSQIVVLMTLTRALGLAVPASYCFVFGPLVNVMAAIPVSLNGLGVREGGYVFFLSHIGIARNSAVAFALVWFAIVMLAGVAGGLVYLAYGPAPARSRRALDRR